MTLSMKVYAAMTRAGVDWGFSLTGSEKTQPDYFHRLSPNSNDADSRVRAIKEEAALNHGSRPAGDISDEKLKEMAVRIARHKGLLKADEVPDSVWLERKTPQQIKDEHLAKTKGVAVTPRAGGDK